MKKINDIVSQLVFSNLDKILKVTDSNTFTRVVENTRVSELDSHYHIMIDSIQDEIIKNE